MQTFNLGKYMQDAACSIEISSLKVKQDAVGRIRLTSPPVPSFGEQNETHASSNQLVNNCSIK